MSNLKKRVALDSVRYPSNGHLFKLLTAKKNKYKAFLLKNRRVYGVEWRGDLNLTIAPAPAPPLYSKYLVTLPIKLEIPH